MDELRARHRGLGIESCSRGGGPPVSHTTGLRHRRWRCTGACARCCTVAGRSAGRRFDDARLHGVVSPSHDHAVYAWVRLVTGADARPGLVRLPGLAPEVTYRVRAVDVTGRDEVRLPGTAAVQPAWCSGPGVTLSGRALAGQGLAMPVLDPGGGVLVEVTAGR